MATNGPAFQFYARDFIVGTLGMTPAEVGLYIRALAVSWDAGPLPADEAVLARTLMVPLPEFRKLWRVVGAKFEATEYGFVNRRLEHERSQQAAFREQQKAKGQASAQARWGNRTGNQKVTTVTSRLQPEGQPNGNSAYCDLHTASSKEQKIKSVSSEAAEIATSEPPLLVFPVIGKGDKTWPLTAAYVAELAGDYPGLDVLGECRSARAWCVANPTKRKTAKGMPAFLVNWLNRAVKGGGQRVAAAPLTAAPRPELGAWRDECEQVHGGRQGDVCGNQTMHQARMDAGWQVAS